MTRSRSIAIAVAVALAVASPLHPVQSFGINKLGNSGGFGGLGNQGGKSASPAPPLAGKLLAVDGVSFILQTDGASKICRAGGC